MSKKGPAAEREVRDLIAAWWAPAEPNTNFVRTPRSGGWHASAEFRAAGDLMCTPGSRFPFAVEIKRREAWSEEQFLKVGPPRPSPVWKWWAQCRRDAKKIDAVPLLIFRKNRRPWLAMLWTSDAPRAVIERAVRTCRCPQGGGNVCVFPLAALLEFDPFLLPLTGRW